MFYGSNKFVLSPRVTVVAGVIGIEKNDLRWLHAIGKCNASCIRSMEIKLSARYRIALLLANVEKSLGEMGIDTDRIKVESSYCNGARWSDFPRKSLQFATR